MKKKQKSIVLLVIMAFALALPMMGNVEASPLTIVEICPKSTVVGIEDSFTVDINISDAIDIFILQFVLRYDPTILDATDAYVVLPSGPGNPLIDGELIGVPTVWNGYDCDINGDGILDIYDFVAWYDAYGTSDPNADINDDGIVDLDDFIILRDAWNNTYVYSPGTIWFMYPTEYTWAGGTFATVTFDAIGPGETVLDLDDVKLAPIIPPEVIDGTVTVTTHDVSVISVSAPAEAIQGDNVAISVDIANLGTYEETFNVEVSYDTNLMNTFLVTLPPGGSTTETFVCDTEFVTPDTYTISAEAILATDENPANNEATTIIMIKSQVEASQDLIDQVESYNLQLGVEKSLTSKLQSAIQLINQGNENGAIHKLMDFIDQVEAKRGKKITTEQADDLIASAQAIIDTSV